MKTMRRLSAIITMLLLATLPMFALSYHAVNVDKVTAAAMTAAYASEAEMEAMNTSNLQKIVDHYKSATVATAGILLSKKKDRDAMRNPGLFASEENYYYKRILNLVKDGIMPKLITVASKMVKQPQNAIYWGPYLFKTTENVEQLCKQFELVCTNGKLSFKDVTFLLINDDLRKIFDLAQMGANTNWGDLLDKLGDFGDGLTKEDIQEDFKNLGSLLASIGGNTIDSNLQEGSKIGKIFHMKPKEIADLYKNFKEQYDKYKEAGNVENILMQVIQTADADGVARLFKVDDYNITGYISNYIKEMQGQYYTQRWYIAQVNSGSQVLAIYKPSPPTNTNNNDNWPGWTFKCNSQKKTAPPYPTLTTSEYNQLKSAAESETGWNATKKADYEKKNPGHTITLSYQTVSYNYIWDKSGGTFSHSKHERGKHFCVYMTVTDTWNIKDEVYEEIFDSQTMNLEIFKKKMESRLKYYQDQEADKEGSTLSYKLCSDPPRYYTMADEKKMEGCNSVSFTATCDGGASLGEGSFNWKENGKQGSSLNEKSKEFAMRSTPDSENNNVDDLLTKQKEYEAQISTLKQQISSNDKKQQELIKQIQQAQSLGNQDKVKSLRSQYDSITNETASLKQQLNNTQKFLNELNNNVNEYYEALADNLDGPYRIPSNMKELEGMYQLQWTDDGNWVEGSSQYIFVRHGYCPSVKSTVTYTATLTLQQKPKYFLGIRIHRAILSVDFKLTSEYSSDNVVAVIKLDMSKSEKERADEVNAKLKELMEEMPNCSISIKYNYASTADNDEDEDAIHLLWASDRLDVAREVDYQLTSIHSQLVILEKVMQDRETILDFLKHKIFDVVSRASRGTIAEYALTRWEDASMAAMKKQAGVEDKKENTPSTQKSDKNV